ncbi:MAG: O-antigen ligase family protein [Bacteroidales bacterium]|nr:O-antigen ligase family protein [Bacteroidales bacterium]MCF6342424.1 O-antigen ligase family protein [Bacteroidales bacterium]
MTEKVKIAWVYGLTALFLIANFYLVLQKDFYWLFLLPLGLIVFYYYLISLDKIILFITFLTPFAVNIRDLEAGLGVSLPTEPMMFGVLMMFIANLLFENKYDRRLSGHPVSYVIYFGLLWMLLTTFTSELPVVSLKYIVSRLWFVVPFYFVAALIFKNMANIHKFFWLYLSALIVIIIYTLTIHSQYGFNEEAGHWVMSPFYNDHTAYGAALAMFVPVAVGFIFYPKSKKLHRFFAILAFLFLAVGLIFSYGRAAWISVAAALGVFILVMLRIKFYWFVLVSAVLIGGFIVFQQQIFDKLEKNKQDSSENFVEHVRSITNISSDASNLERINRWQAAIRLYEERPVLGWGPGTYQFVYAPFQRSKEKTTISTNLGDRGNAHSEYLGPLAEMGLPGMLFVLLLMVYVIYTGLKVYKKTANREVKFLTLMATLGLVTYYTHGVLNNFLDSDKLSVPFWGFTAIIVALDTFHLKRETAQEALRD